MEDINDVMNFVEDDNDIIAAYRFTVAARAAILEEAFRDYAPWVKIFVDVEGWRRLGDPTFKTHFRMSKTVFQELLLATRHHLLKTKRMHFERTPFELCLMMSLWILMNMDTFRSTAIIFNKSPGVVHYHYRYIIQAIREMAPQYIQWPSHAERQVLKQRFFQKCGLSGVIAAIDGVHSYITAPLEEPEAFVNRHHNHSILSQAVMDCDMLVRDLYVGERGSLHDSRMFRRSPLCSNLLEDPSFLAPDEHIIADAAYILTNKVIIPHDDIGQLNAVQRTFNHSLSSARSVVERGFAYAKNKLARLKYFRSLRVKYAVDHIVSCFVIHNFMILNGAEVPIFVRLPHQQVEEPGGNHVDDEDPDDPDGLGDPDNERAFGDFPDVDVEPDHPLLAEANALDEDKREALANRVYRRMMAQQC